MKTGQPKNESLSNFFIAAAHASDVCEYIRDKRKPDFDLLPHENDEADIDAAFGYWRLRGLFGEDAQGFPAQNAMHLQLGDITAIPVSAENMQK